MARRFPKEHKPRRGESVWIEGQPQPNGVIIAVDWDDGEPQEITVRFHETKDVQVYYYHEFDGNWTDKFGGTWMIHKLGE